MKELKSDLKIAKDDHVKGDDERPITLIQYADYRCPFSGAAFPVIQETLAEYQEVIRFVYRHFPLVQLHPGAFLLSQFAEAAGRQGHFWAAHQLLFGSQNLINDEKLTHFLLQQNVDESRFREDIESKEVSAKIMNDMMTGKKLGVHKTPSFFLNGRLFQSEWHQSGLRDQIRDLLGKQHEAHPPI